MLWDRSPLMLTPGTSEGTSQRRPRAGSICWREPSLLVPGPPTPWARPRLCHMNAVCENGQRLTIIVPILQMGKVRHRVQGSEELE